jgi:pyrrolidone-carboxylate peptidase
MEGGEEQCVAFYLTGFGRFQGVDDNPTTHLIHHLPNYLAEHLPSSIKERCHFLSFTVLETSGVGSLQQLCSLIQQHKLKSKKLKTNSNQINIQIEIEKEKENEIVKEQNKEKETKIETKIETETEKEKKKVVKTVWLHLGVHGGATEFLLERVAWNEAHFRCPDERGWQPTHQPIIASNGPVTANLGTSLPLKSIKQTLRKKFRHPTSLSIDPGRFVCNWIYYHSLYFGRQEAQHDHDSLFVHVPPFECIPQAAQLAFVRDLIIAITAHLLPLVSHQSSSS